MVEPAHDTKNKTSHSGRIHREVDPALSSGCSRWTRVFRPTRKRHSGCSDNVAINSAMPAEYAGKEGESAYQRPDFFELEIENDISMTAV